MKNVRLLPFLLGLLIALPDTGLGQARLVHPGPSALLGICGGKLIMIGRQGAGTTAIFTYNGRKVAVGATYSPSGPRPFDPWGSLVPIPTIPGVAPFFMAGGAKSSLATTCGSVASTEVILPGIFGMLDDNVTFVDGKIIVSRINRKSIELFSISAGKATLLGKVATIRQDPLNKAIGGNVYKAQQGLILEAPAPDSRNLILWKLTEDGFVPLTTFPELQEEGYTNPRVRKVIQTGDGKLVFRVVAKSSTGQATGFLYVTDGSDVKQLAFSSIDVSPLKDIDGFLGIFQDPARGPNDYGCRAAVFRAPNYTGENVTPPSGLIPGVADWCGKVIPRVTSGSSLFFSTDSDRKTLRRFNVETGEVSTVFSSSASFGHNAMYFLYGRLFFRLERTLGEFNATELYVSDGTAAGTRQIKVGKKPLLGAEPARSLWYDDELFIHGFTSIDLRTGRLGERGLYRIDLPVGEIIE
jgi:hypothetical protein